MPETQPDYKLNQKEGSLQDLVFQYKDFEKKVEEANLVACKENPSFKDWGCCPTHQALKTERDVMKNEALRLAPEITITAGAEEGIFQMPGKDLKMGHFGSEEWLSLAKKKIGVE